MTTLIVGCGYLGRRIGQQLAACGERVLGTCRTAEKAEAVRPWGIDPVVYDVLEPTPLPSADRAIFCVGYDRKSGIPIGRVYGDGLAGTLDINGGRIGRWLYVSSTGVYGQDDGSWIDEDSPVDPKTESGWACRKAEQVVMEVANEPFIVRLSGLYGPARIVRREAIVQGEPIAGDPERFLNLIHIDDAAGAVLAVLDRGEAGSITLASDDRPVRRREYYGLVAEQLSAPSPRFDPSSGAARDDAHKRVSNRRLREVIGYRLRYPDITTGVPAALHAADQPAAPGS